ncbi:hypothetical protein GY45DRAFT_506840 [Cubamyces sp. BRFM 1775]|nr:hypothetical protein GY45DRAFT_506840 [Cubamyces sp. BRFM 1775]
MRKPEVKGMATTVRTVRTGDRRTTTQLPGARPAPTGQARCYPNPNPANFSSAYRNLWAPPALPIHLRLGRSQTQQSSAAPTSATFQRTTVGRALCAHKILSASRAALQKTANSEQGWARSREREERRPWHAISPTRVQRPSRSADVRAGESRSTLSHSCDPAPSFHAHAPPCPSFQIEILPSFALSILRSTPIPPPFHIPP